MTAVLPLILGALTLFYTGWFAVQTTARSASLAAKSRVGVITAGGDALVALVLAHALIPWSQVPPALWFLPVGITAAGVAGAVLRWQALPILKPGGRRKLQIVIGIIHVVACVAIIVIVLAL